jgi:hypothetical protein
MGSFESERPRSMQNTQFTTCAHIQWFQLQDVFGVEGSDQMLLGENPKIIEAQSFVNFSRLPGNVRKKSNHVKGMVPRKYI